MPLNRHSLVHSFIHSFLKVIGIQAASSYTFTQWNYVNEGCGGRIQSLLRTMFHSLQAIRNPDVLTIFH